MYPFLRGRRSFAVVLCRFNDLPPPAVPRSRFLEFVSEYGRAGLHDYFNEISYGQFGLAGSEVFGWYTMKYSFATDSRDPFKQAPGAPLMFPRTAWIAEARRLAAEHGVDLSRFHGVIAVINAQADDSASGNDLALAVADWGQNGWRHCQRCEGLFHSQRDRGVCPLGGRHDVTGSKPYLLSHNDPGFPGQGQWRHCVKCRGLVFAGGAAGTCAAGGVHDVSGSGEYRLGTGNVGYVGQAKWKWCRKCQSLAYSERPGVCPAGEGHDFSASSDYTVASSTNGLNTTFGAHETAHALGFAHSWAAGTPDKKYGDSWDIMSAMLVKTFENVAFSPAGPGFNAPNLHRWGWLPDDRVLTHMPVTGLLSVDREVQLAALNRPELPGPMMARIIAGDRIYTVEYRQRTQWDRGLERDAVFIHELRSHYTVGEQHWRWCGKCQGLHHAGHLRCAAGGLHDLTASAEYRVAVDDASAGGQRDWRWCSKCQQLAYAGGDPGACPAGGSHDHGTSGDYRLPSSGAGQSGWKWCQKCQGLSYASGSSIGVCPLGGVHDYSGSGTYVVMQGAGTVGQPGWRWCRGCQGLIHAGMSHCPAGGSHAWHDSDDYALLPETMSEVAGQTGWARCTKCRGLVFAGPGSDLGACPAGGSHAPGTGGRYRLLPAGSFGEGQADWRWCRKCQALHYGPNVATSRCPRDGGVHDTVDSGDYAIAPFSERVFLVGGERLPGAVFTDAPRNVSIHVDAFDGAAGIALIRLGGGVTGVRRPNYL